MIINPTVYGGKDKSKGLTAKGSDIRQGKTALVNGEKIIGTLPEIDKPTISVGVSSQGVVTATGILEAGITTGGELKGTKPLNTTPVPKPVIAVDTSGKITAKVTTGKEGIWLPPGTKIEATEKPLTTQAGKTVTPSTSTQTAVASGKYTTGTVYVAGDSDLKGSNIVNTANIFGVQGTVVPYFTVTASSAITAFDGSDIKITWTNPVGKKANNIYGIFMDFPGGGIKEGIIGMTWFRDFSNFASNQVTGYLSYTYYPNSSGYLVYGQTVKVISNTFINFFPVFNLNDADPGGEQTFDLKIGTSFNVNHLYSAANYPVTIIAG